MSGHNLDDLIRTVNPLTFSEAAHGRGHRILVSDGAASLYKSGLMGRLLGKRSDRHVFVKRWSVPKEVKDWRFRWSEGTTSISLEFDASFVIQANEDVQAMQLAKALASGPEDGGEVLYGLINARLHDELAILLRKCDSQALSLLDEFRHSSIGIGESEALNRAVTESVSRLLGGAHFRIGFQLNNVPPMQVEVKCTDSFTLADSKRPRTADTTALLQLENYQAYKKSGLETESAVRETIQRSIAQAVKQLLFARKYYAVVQSFTQGVESVVRQMEARIQADAQAIGYRVKMFQTFPDIAALKLLEPTRIEIPAGDEKYPLLKATGFVQISVTLSVKVAGDFSKLHLLIDPDSGDVAEPIVARVRQICRDNIQRFDHKAFNLSFEESIVPELRKAIVGGLALYGLKTEVVHVRDLPTEEASRFLAIRGRTIDFKAEISPHADDGDGDPVPVVGAIEVTGLTDNGWAQFEGKDFGYRQDSQWSELRMRQLAQGRGVVLSEGIQRRALAIELELIDIRDRVVGTLEGSMSMGPALARHWTDWKSNREISDWAMEMAERAIAAEYGLSIALRGFRRLDTQTETTLREQRLAKQEQLRNVAREAARNEIEHQQKLRSSVDANQVEMLNRHGQIERQALADESDVMHQQVREKVAREARELEEARRRVGANADALLPPPRKHDSGSAQLPWQRMQKHGRENPERDAPDAPPTRPNSG